MVDLPLIGDMLIKREEHVSDDEITNQMTSRGYSSDDVKQAFDKIDNGFVLVVKTIAAMTPIAPITYRFGVRRIERETNILWGMIRDTKDIGVKMIDTVRVNKGLVDASVSIVHADKNEILISKISRGDAEKIRSLYAYIIEAQRKSVINVSQD